MLINKQLIYLKDIKHLDLGWNSNITDTGLQYLKGDDIVIINNKRVI